MTPAVSCTNEVAITEPIFIGEQLDVGQFTIHKSVEQHTKLWKGSKNATISFSPISLAANTRHPDDGSDFGLWWRNRHRC